MTNTRDARQDLVGGLRPLERLRSLVRDVDVAPDRRLDFTRAAVRATAQLLFGKRGEPSLDQIRSRAAGRREVYMKPRMPQQQPAVNRRRLVSAGVVDDHVDVERGRHRPVDGARNCRNFRARWR